MSHRPAPGWTLQAGWDAGIEGVVRGLAVDLAPIRVNCVTSGIIHTEVFDKMPSEAVGTVLQGFRDASLTGTVGTADEAAESYVYFMKSGFVTGTTAVVDGGGCLK